MDRKAHWERVYAAKPTAELSWYQPWPSVSLDLLAQIGMTAESQLINVGGGDSTLVDALLERPQARVTVLDISGAALARAQARLGARARDVTWLEADVTRTEFAPESYDVWHDRAVFHFLTDPQDRQRYVAAATQALRTGGTIVLATFAPDGPLRCSGLQVARYSAEDLAIELGKAFTLTRSVHNVHHTPTGVEQCFTYAVLRRQ